MDRATNINLVNIFRSQEEKFSAEKIQHHEEFLLIRSSRAEPKASAFLVDQKYSLQLDELI